MVRTARGTRVSIGTGPCVDLFGGELGARLPADDACYYPKNDTLVLLIMMRLFYGQIKVFVSM